MPQLTPVYQSPSEVTVLEGTPAPFGSGPIQLSPLPTLSNVKTFRIFQDEMNSKRVGIVSQNAVVWLCQVMPDRACFTEPGFAFIFPMIDFTVL